MIPNGAYANLARRLGYLILAITLGSVSLAQAQTPCAKVDVVKIQEYAGSVATA